MRTLSIISIIVALLRVMVQLKEDLLEAVSPARFVMMPATWHVDVARLGYQPKCSTPSAHFTPAEAEGRAASVRHSLMEAGWTEMEDVPGHFHRRPRTSIEKRCNGTRLYLLVGVRKTDAQLQLIPKKTVLSLLSQLGLGLTRLVWIATGIPVAVWAVRNRGAVKRAPGYLSSQGRKLWAGCEELDRQIQATALGWRNEIGRQLRTESDRSRGRNR